jgi:DNA-binding SARP family transcriptional activator
MAAEELRALQARAASFLREQARSEEAFELFLQMKDFDGLRELLLELAPTFFAQGRVALLERWLEVLPRVMIAETAWLTYWQSMCRLISDPSSSRAGLERALVSFEGDCDANGAYLAWAGAVQAMTYEGRKWPDVETWIERLEKIERISPTFASPEVGWQVASSLLMLLTLAGTDSAMVERWGPRALSLAEGADAPSARVMTASVLVLNYALRGDSGHAAALMAQLERASSDAATGALASVAARAATTALAWHRGDAESALRAALDGLALMGNRRVPMWQSALLVFGAQAAIDLGNWPQASRLLDRLAQNAEESTPLEVSAYHATRAHEALVRGDLKTALVAAELSLDRANALGFPYGQGRTLHVIAYVSFELGDAVRAREALETARAIEGKHKDAILCHWRLLIEADRALRDGNATHTAMLLREAFAIGREREVYCAPCISSARLAALCRFALHEQIESEYCRSLVRQRQLQVTPAPLELSEWPWPIRIHTISRIEVLLDERPVNLGRARMVPMFLKTIVALGVGGRPVESNRIISVLWPEAEGDAGMRVLDVTLLRLRKQLGAHGRRAIRMEGGRICLDGSICWTDVDALNHLLTEVSGCGGKAPADSYSVQSVGERLLALCPGPFVGAADRPPALLAIDDHLRSRASSALCQICSWLEQLGSASTAESLYIRGLEAGVCTEALLAPAIGTMIRRGRMHEARTLLEVYRQQGTRSETAEALLNAQLGR